MRGLSRAFLVFLLCMMCAYAAGQQAPTASDAESTVLRVTTRMVVIDVVALDSSGKPITSLTRNDFTILENGKPQKIASFAVRTSTNVPHRQVPLLQAHVTTNRPDLRTPDAPAVVL